MPTPKKQGVIDAISHKILCEDNIKILPMSDLHIGDKNCNYELINKLISNIKNDDKTYTILAGDLMNTAIVGSKSDSYNEELTPQQQLEKCVSLLTPIKHKILAIVPGNHEERISRTAGVDMTKLLANSLNISELYSATSALLMIQLLDKENEKKKKATILYSAYINHGHGGGRRIGGKANGLSDFGAIIDADLLLQGHTHTPIVFRQSHYRISQQNGCATPHEQVYINLPSAMSYGGYGNRNGYQPASNKYPVIILDSKEHKIDVLM